MQPCTEARPATVGSIVAMRVRNVANADERRARAAVFAIDQQAPVTRGGQILEHGIGDFAVRIEQRAGLFVAVRDGERTVHHVAAVATSISVVLAGRVRWGTHGPRPRDGPGCAVR